MKNLIFGIISIQICTSCSVVGHGFDRDAIQSELALQMPSLSDEDIRKASMAKSDLKAPFSVAVFYRESRDRDLTNSKSSQWTSFDRKKISETLQKLKEKSLVSEYQELSSLMMPGRDLRSLLFAGAHAHCDSVLELSGIGAVDSYENLWAVTYLPLFTMFFVRGTNVDALYKIKANFWDIKNQYLLFATDFEYIQKEVRPGWARNEQNVLEKAKTKAFELLIPELMRRFSKLHNQSFDMRTPAQATAKTSNDK